MAEGDILQRKCDKMTERISKIRESTGGESQGNKRPCIFKIDQTSDNDRFTPKVVSIGPYCRDIPRLRKREDFKWQCLEYSLKRSNKNMKDYLEKIQPLEKEAKECYSESSAGQLDDFLELMVLDGCFIVEFIRFAYSIQWEGISDQSIMKKHPLARVKRAIPKICADFLMLQNQIPYKVLEGVFEVSKVDDESQSLPTLGLEFFSEILGSYYPSSRKPPEVEWMHLLDLVRSIFIPSNYEWSSGAKETSDEIQIPLGTIPCITKLRLVGIKVRPHSEDSLVVNFQHGAIEMPQIALNDLMCSFLENCVRLKQRHNDRSKHFSVYAVCLDCLVKTPSDVEYLCEHRVILNYLKTDEDAANFFNNLGKGLTFSWDYDYFFKLYDDVENYCKNKCRQQWTSFKREYFEKPWLWISVLAGFVLLVLTFMQTYYTVYAYLYPKN